MFRYLSVLTEKTSQTIRHCRPYLGGNQSSTKMLTFPLKVSAFVQFCSKKS